ncbi:MAG TPA: histidine kinase, partial [Chitinophagaceae bacterium]|nr:histidine kinase [Chitinophagaceae bacterium]
MATSSSLWVMDENTMHKTKTFNPKPYNLPGSALRIYSMAADPSDSSLWISRSDGLFSIGNETEQAIRRSGRISFRRFTFVNQNILGITDKNQLLLISRYQGRLLTDTLYEPNCIWENVYPIDSRHCLISTNQYYRLLTLHPSAGKNGHSAYQLKAIENPFFPLQAESIAADSATCYFFKDDKITCIDTKVLYAEIKPPLPAITGIRTRDTLYPARPEITISYMGSRHISILFDNIAFTGKTIFNEYTLSENGADEWRPLSGNEININNPGFGDYTVKIRSKSLSSAYSPPAILHLHIRKPFWATWWFLTLAGIAFTGLIWGIVQLLAWRKIRKQQKEHEADMKYQQSEYKALNALMNPHFIFNSLNNIQGLINKDEKRTANQYLVIFSDLVRQNMHNISKGFISLRQELDLVE